jgi:hypothetical protein
MYQTRIICARVFLACINREEETTEARKVQRERDTMGEILMISRWIIFLWCFCFGVKNLSQIFEKRNAPLTAPPQKTTIITRQKSATGGQTPRTSRENKNRKEQKKEKKEGKSSQRTFLVFDTSSFTRVLHNKETL